MRGECRKTRQRHPIIQKQRPDYGELMITTRIETGGRAVTPEHLEY